MKRRLIRFAACAILAYGVLFIISMSLKASYRNGFVAVYITSTGDCYHRDGCTYLHSKIKMTLEEAVEKNYYPCSRCKPPKLGEYTEKDIQPYLSYEQRMAIEKAEEEKEKYEEAKKAEEEKEKLERAAEQKAIEDALEQEREKRKQRQTFIGCVVVIFLIILANQIPKQKEKRDFFKKNPYKIPGMPSNTIIGSDGLPKIAGKYKWGKFYTFYVSATGSSYHKSPNCSKGAYFPIHAVCVGNRTPCKKCKPVLPNLRWYFEYTNNCNRST